ncbi:MAG TPA: hypothetical protein VM223_22555 [Planctomycetota bacterium]|nr:hypothetical protein [Planctomycetota bacterium]
MPSPVASSSRRRRVLPRVAIVLLLACLIALLVFAIVHDSRPVGRFSVSGDPIDMKLIGVRPDLGEELFDPSGKPLPPMVLPSLYKTWSNNDLPRDLILKLPEGHERLLLSIGYATLSVNPDVRVGVVRTSDSRIVEADRDSLLFYGDLRKDSAFWYGKWPFRRRRTHLIDLVDVHIPFFGTEPRGNAEFTFTGPFLYSKDYQESSGQPATIRFGHGFIGDHVFFDFSTPVRYTERKPVLVYDASGNRHRPEGLGGGYGSNGANLHYRIDGLPLDRIAAITVGETPREKVFHNVQVAYPGRREQTRSSAIRALEARLGPDPKLKLDAKQALDLIDVLQDYKLEQAVDKLTSSRNELELDQEAKQKVRSVAERLAASPDLSMRRCGVMLGLKYGGMEFADPAIDLTLSSGKRTRQRVAWMLSQRPKDLTPQHIARIKDALRKTDDPRVLEPLFQCVSWSANSGDELWELAQDDRPWLWLPALLDIPKALGDRKADDLPLKIKARIGAIVGVGAFRYPTVPFEQLAGDLPLSLPTPELARMSSGSFSRVLNRIGKWPDRAAATAALIRFLDGASREPVPWYSVYRVVKQINAWHGVDIGGLGAGPETDRHVRQDWQLVAADAVAWYHTGVDPGSVQPDADSPRPGDVRVVFSNLSDPARSISGAWIEPRAGVPHLRHFRVKQGDITFFYCLSRDGLGTEQKLNCRFFAVKEGEVCWEKNELLAGFLPATIGTLKIDADEWECRLEPLDQPSPNLP